MENEKSAYQLTDPYNSAEDTVMVLTPVKNPKKLDCVTKLLVVATTVNFVLIVATAVTISFFLARAATKSEVGTVSDSVAGLQQSVGTGSGSNDSNTPDSQGPPGPPGPAGEVGPAGPVGPAGQVGPAGEAGDPGAAGDPGVAGDDGPPGIQGPIGPMGPQGETGADGGPGTPGDRGMVGPAGPMGDPGNPGAQGVMGMTGDPGATGGPGDPGPPGDPGAQGMVGSTGPQGMTGMTGPPGPPPAIVGGATYTRWGHTSCRTGVNLLYAGRTGSTFVQSQGGASNYVCMPNDPEYGTSFTPGVQSFNWVVGTEYELTLVPGSNQHNAPCALCYVPTSHAVIMIPAKNSCPSGWTLEYQGYLMSEARLHYRTTYECVDTTLESLPGTGADDPAGHFYHVEAHCSGMPCPPYDENKELSCVVCSR